MTDETMRKIDAIFDRWSRGLSPGGQVVIRVAGQVVYDRCFGYADLEKRVPITDKTVYHVASVSKQFTVMGAMLLAEEGKLDIDADIRTYVPQYVGFSQPVTVRDLMNNDTGIRDMLELADRSGVVNEDSLDQDYVLRLIARQKDLNFAPRSRHLYSNSNFILLASVVEVVSGKSLREYLEERIFRPLGMTRTTVRDKCYTCLDGRASSYHDNGTEWFWSPLTYSIYGTTSLHSTGHDLMKWIDQYRTPTLCSSETIRIMTTAAKLDSGLPNTYACGLREDYLEGHRYIKHAGEDAGFRTFTFRLMDDDIDIVQLANCETVMSDPAVMEVARVLLGLPPAPPPVLPVDRDFDPKDAPGFYYGEDCAAAVSIVERQGGLAVIERTGPAPLTHLGGGVYRQGCLDTWYVLGPDGPCMINAEETIPLCKCGEEPVGEAFGNAAIGRYFSPEVEAMYTVTFEDGRLYVEHIRRGKSLLHPMGAGCFAAEYDRSCYVRFEQEGDRITGLTLTGSRVLALRFEKIQ